MRVGNVFSHVCLSVCPSVCLSVRLSIWFYVSHTVGQAGGLHSTEMRSCFNFSKQHKFQSVNANHCCHEMYETYGCQRNIQRTRQNLKKLLDWNSIWSLAFVIIDLQIYMDAFLWWAKSKNTLPWRNTGPFTVNKITSERKKTSENPVKMNICFSFFSPLEDIVIEC